MLRAIRRRTLALTASRSFAYRGWIGTSDQCHCMNTVALVSPGRLCFSLRRQKLVVSLRDESFLALQDERMECGHPRFFFLTWSQEFQEVINIAQKIENSVQLVIGLRFHSPATKDVDHELWLASLSEFRQPGAHAPWLHACGSH